MNSELIKNANNIVNDRQERLKELKEERKRLISEENIIYLLSNLLERVDKNIMPCYITHNFENRNLRIIAFNEYIDKFINLFDEKECLKMTVNNDYYKSTDLLFLIDENKLLEMYINKDSLNKEADASISAEIKNIDSCIAKNYSRKVYHRDPLKYEEWYNEYDSLVFKNSKKLHETKVFELDDNNKDFIGKDIRKLINPISLEEILERTINLFENEESMKLVKTK